MQNEMQTKEYFLSVVSASLCGEKIPQKGESADFADLYKLAARNSVQGLFYLAFSSQKSDLPEAFFQKLQKAYQLECIRETAQQAFLEKLRADFSAVNIDFMLLKGTHLKALYPQPEMRFMVDMDVLVRAKDLEKAKEILLSNGLTLHLDNGKDIVFQKKPFLTVELHRSLFQEDCFMYPYFSSAWDRAEKADGTEYKMPKNDLYVYTLAHLAEHYLEAGSCFRPMMDLFLLEKSDGEALDFPYIDAQFKKIGILPFAKNVRRLQGAMFAGAPYDATLRMMENYIVLGAPVQNAEAAAISAADGTSKTRRLLGSLFPPYKRMLLRYPILKKCPILLPILWVYRIIRLTFTKDKRVQRKRERLKNTNRESTDVLQQIFKQSGL